MEVKCIPAVIESPKAITTLMSFFTVKDSFLRHIYKEKTNNEDNDTFGCKSYTEIGVGLLGRGGQLNPCALTTQEKTITE